MGYRERKVLYTELEAKRGRPLISYITSGRPNASGMIAQDAVRPIVDQLYSIPKGTQSVDLLVNSYGGDGLASWRIVTIIREYLGKKGKVYCLVPHYAYSAATLLAVGCDEILMHPSAALGPVDPQVTARKKDGTPQQFAYEDLVAYTRFLREEGGMSEQVEKKDLINSLVQEISPSVIGGSKRASLQSKVMAERLLRLHLAEAEHQKAEVIAEKLNKNFNAHGHSLPPGEAKMLGLNIAKSNPAIEDLIWKVYVDIEEELKMRQVFDPLSMLLNAVGSNALLDPPDFLSMPANLPPQFIQQTMQQHITQIKGPVVDFTLTMLVVESARTAFHYKNKGKILGFRQPDLTFKVSSPILSSGWETAT